MQCILWGEIWVDNPLFSCPHKYEKVEKLREDLQPKL